MNPSLGLTFKPGWTRFQVSFGVENVPQNLVWMGLSHFSSKFAWRVSLIHTKCGVGHSGALWTTQSSECHWAALPTLAWAFHCDLFHLFMRLNQEFMYLLFKKTYITHSMNALVLIIASGGEVKGAFGKQGTSPGPRHWAAPRPPAAQGGVKSWNPALG